MSFNVNWKNLETDSLRSWTTELLTNALNSGKRPTILASDIVIKDLNFGKIAPNFEILEIGELDKDRFRGIFKINYEGDFHLTLHTKVQANPLKIYSDNSLEKEVSSPFITPDFLLSVDPFNLPLDLKLSDIKISGIGIIVFSKTKGLTLVFRNDPLDSIKVSSTFDTVQVLAKFLQEQIENQIRDLFRETLPTLIHKFSLKYTSLFNNDDLMNNLKDHLSNGSFGNNFDLLEIESVSANNLHKLASLYSSRETLNLSIPKFKKIVQRNHLEKFNKHLFPNLVNSLYSNLNLSTTASATACNNSIPVELLVNNDFNKVDDILKEISNIQAKTFKSANNDNKAPRRRTIKLGKKLKMSAPAPLESFEAVKMSQLATEYSDAVSDTTLIEEPARIEHPTPVKVKPTQLQAQPIKHSANYNKLEAQVLPRSHLPISTPAYNHIASQPHLNGCPSPLSSNSSFVGSVGLGNSYFNFPAGAALSTSPLRRESSKPKTSTEGHTLKVKKSLNHLDIKLINEKLQMCLDEKLLPEKQAVPPATFELPPPPYYQLHRA